MTKEQKLEIDKQVRKNRFKLKDAIFFPFLPVPIIPTPQIPFFPGEGFNPQQIVRKARDRAQSAVEEKLRPLAETVDDCTEAYKKYKDGEETIKSAKKLVKTWKKLNAEEKYESIRNSKIDVDAIAKTIRYKMRFIKTNEIYKIVRITGNSDNILGVCFTQKNNELLEIIEWDLKNTETIKTSRSEIQLQVLSGLRLVNQYLNTNYRVSKIDYVPVDSPNNSIYEFLIQELIKHLHRG